VPRLIHRGHTAAATPIFCGQVMVIEELRAEGKVLFDGPAGGNEKSTCVSLRRLFVGSTVLLLCAPAC